MNKGELASYIAEFTGVSKAAAKLALILILAVTKTARVPQNRSRLGASSRISLNVARSRASQRILGSSKITANVKSKSRNGRNLKRGANLISSARRPTIYVRVNSGDSENRVNKSQLVNRLMVSAGVSKAEANRAFDGAIAVLQKRDKVSLAGVRNSYVGKLGVSPGQPSSAGASIKFKAEQRESGETNYKVVKLFFGTDRKYSKEATEPYKYFKNSRGHDVHYGSCEVSIPREHKTGNLEAPYILRHYLQNPEKHVVLMRILLKSKDEFFDEVCHEPVLDSKRKALVFIHGFNNSFEDVARRTAQIAHDIDFKGVPIFYSWPSKGRLGKKAYVFDGNELLQAILYLKQFIREIATKGDFDSITLIAHSMGNRALTEAFISLNEELKVAELKVFKEIILAAPDIDADYFRNTIAPALIKTTAATTLYASSKDLALIESKKVNGAPRAGDSGAGLVVIDGIETIDATNADTNLFWGANHAYIADSKELLTDLFYLIERGQRAVSRYLDPVPTKVHPEYWKLKK